MYQMVRPQVAIPVHGEARHLIGHAELARHCQVQQAVVIENGDMVRLDRGGAAIVDEVPAGRIASDGKSLLPIGGAVLQQRRRAGVDGTAVASLVVDRAGSLAAPPDEHLAEDDGRNGLKPAEGSVTKQCLRSMSVHCRQTATRCRETGEDQQTAAMFPAD